ncbi:MAG: bifunctional histidinol-phosphatase/imidazoleglycerol-phosphate dehydratase HisB [Muribaculaceae bacterium]|nr:bifunctional histidinol-phosphatase/imidazoleglycerol-phosphate dehydratase HisB [Muribaculaceae bacterium]
MKKAIFIDRDGTIIREPADEQIDSLEKLEFVPGVISALRLLSGKGYELVMVTNQDGLGTSSFPEETFWPAHNKMLRTLEGEGITFDAQYIDRTFPYENAPTRKPGTAMLTSYLQGDYDLQHSYVIGDRHTDIELAKNLGAKGIFLGTPEEAPEDSWFASQDWHQIAKKILDSQRCGTVKRNTRETEIEVEVLLDGEGRCDVSTGLHFFDHMLSQIPHHSGISLKLHCKGDLDVDEHHTMEDTAIALGEAIQKALGDKRGIERYGFVLPMDEAQAQVLIDLGGRSEFRWNVPFTREYVGDTPTEMYRHFFKSLSDSLGCNLHIEAKGENNHHLIEGVFKAFARALKAAVKRDLYNDSLPTSKGVI